MPSRRASTAAKPGAVISVSATGPAPSLLCAPTPRSPAFLHTAVSHTPEPLAHLPRQWWRTNSMAPAILCHTGCSATVPRQSSRANPAAPLRCSGRAPSSLGLRRGSSPRGLLVDQSGNDRGILEMRYLLHVEVVASSERRPKVRLSAERMVFDELPGQVCTRHAFTFLVPCCCLSLVLCPDAFPLNASGHHCCFSCLSTVVVVRAGIALI